ncbi:MAG TPA: OmpA family protein, partial [Chitinophagaceae bacterium]|nr:OmpA family protein [Chitinophagaceae bacterium]
FTRPLVNAPGPITIKRDTVSNIYLDHVYFLPDKPVITYESLTDIEELAKNLKTYTTETFEIIGHINYQSRFDSTHLTDLYQLSELRAKAVYESLVESGIPKSRMTYRGVGNAQPVYPSPENDDQRKKNMRVQVIIIK